MHDPRVGRFLSIDPLASRFPHNSPYAFSENRVIDMVELEGGETDLPPYLWETYSTQKHVFGEEGGYRTAYVIGGKWHIQLSYGSSIYYNGTSWIKNFNHTNNKDWIIENGYQHTIKELKILKDGGFFDKDAGAWARWVVNNPLPITKETLSMYGYAFDLDMDLVARMQMLATAVEAGTMAGDASFSFKANIANRKYSFKGITASSSKKVSTIDDFVSPHAYNRHRYNPEAISSKSKTQYGEGVDVKDVRMKTMNNPDKIVHHINEDGVHYATTYKKTFDYNISTSDTPTNESRVIINHLDASRSSQFPLYQKPNTTE